MNPKEEDCCSNLTKVTSTCNNLINALDSKTKSLITNIKALDSAINIQIKNVKDLITKIPDETSKRLLGLHLAALNNNKKLVQTILSNTEPSQKGGSNHYYKYMKYKNRYLQLKNTVKN